MNDLDSLSLDRACYSFKELIGQRSEPRPRTKPRTVTASANVNPVDDLVLVSGNSTLTLETAVGCDGRRHAFLKTDASNTMTIACTGAQTLDGASTATATAQYQVIGVISNGTNWNIEFSYSSLFTMGTLTNHGVLVGQGTSPIVATAAGSTGQVLRSGGGSADPLWSTPTFPNAATSNKALVGDGTNVVLSTPTIPLTSAPGAGKVMIGDGTNWVASTPTYPNASATAGKVIRADGTNFLSSTFTIPDTYAQGDIIYASATSVFSALAKNASASRYLSNTGTTNNPAWAQVDLTNGVTGTLPIGNGGTGNSASTWSTYTPTISSTTGTITTPGTCTGRFFQQGKIVWWQASLAITTNGTGATLVQVTLPSGPGNVVSAARYYGTGLGVLVSGKQLLIKFQNGTQTGFIQNYDGTYPGATGELLEVSGFYEVA